MTEYNYDHERIRKLKVLLIPTMRQHYERETDVALKNQYRFALNGLEEECESRTRSSPHMFIGANEVRVENYILGSN